MKEPWVMGLASLIAVAIYEAELSVDERVQAIYMELNGKCMSIQKMRESFSGPNWATELPMGIVALYAAQAIRRHGKKALQMIDAGAELRSDRERYGAE